MASEQFAQVKELLEGIDLQDVTLEERRAIMSDLLGLDTVLHVAEHLQASYGDRFYVDPAMKELVEAGNLGQKTGQGYYTHGG